MLLASDVDGIHDGVGADDKFIWMQRQNTTMGALSSATPDGFFISGEPASAGFGSCTYDQQIGCFANPCGVNAFSGLPCGTGLDTFDSSWINVDGVAPGGTPPPARCHQFGSAYGFGTNCYFFGGYPSNPLASFWLVLESDGRSACSSGGHCFQTKPTSVPGCAASLSVCDLTLASGVWSTTNIPRDASVAAGTTVGIYIYTHGVGTGQSSFRATLPFGQLCLQSFKRSSPACAAATLATLPGVCNPGALEIAVNCNTGSLGLAVGEDVNVQCWYRDPGAAANASFSNAIDHTVQ